MSKLNHIEFAHFPKPFISQMLQNSHGTLQYLRIRTLEIPEINFSKLRKFALDMISSQEFRENFPQMLSKMENVEIVDLWLYGNPQQTLEYISQNYTKHCISTVLDVMPDSIPVKIVTEVCELEDLENKNHLDAIEYLHICCPEDGGDFGYQNGWDRYKEILDQCISLKAIEISTLKHNLCLSADTPTKGAQQLQLQ
jgi:hypothetical protein